jgi:amino acid adenylation domain-containing protein
MSAQPDQLSHDLAVATTQAQREIFSASLLDPDASLGYNHSITVWFKGPLDVDAIYSALLNLLDRHEALRGHFSADGLEFLVRQDASLVMPLLDLSAQPEAARQEAHAQFLDRELAHVFDLVEGPLFRATLVKFAPDHWALTFNCHHAVVDGWSLKIILDDLPKLYTALVEERESADLEEPSSFVEYLQMAGQREQEQSAAVRAYWKQAFADGTPVLELPVDFPRPRLRSFASRRIDYRLEQSTYQRLVEVGAKTGVSQFATLLSAFALFLHRLSGQDDLVVGVPAAGQITSGKAKLLGHDARVMPIRCVLQEDDTFASYSRRVMDTFLAAYEHQWISIPELLRELKPAIDASRTPFVSVMFNFDPGMKQEDFRFGGLEAHHFFNARKAETFEISVNAVVEGRDMVLEWVYNTTLFDGGEMQLRLAQLEELMRSIAAQPELATRRLGLLPAAQVEAMDRALNATTMEYERELCTDALVERSVQRHPGKVALEFGAASLTYSELWQRSGRIAAAILGMGLGPKPLVGVMLDRSEAMVEVLLGVWRAGGAFVPLDPAYPADRLQYMVDHSRIRVVLTQGALAGAPALSGAQLVDVATIPASLALAPGQEPAGRSPEDRAYVIYTSGSTGKPKGVQVPHRALNNFLKTMRTQAPGMIERDRVLAVTTLSFDIAELELWLPLTTGATVVVVDRGTAIDGHALAGVLRDHHVNFVQATPATWRVLLFSGWQGDRGITALCGGEALPRDLADELLPRVGALWNVYGPTETTVWSTIDKVGEGPVTIGRPIGNTQAYVLDAALQWVPRGSTGELWLGGDGVTHGYLGRDDLTRERFVANPFTGQGRMYKTGDLVRLRLDGRIEYVGRNDFQVKVRGYRIELGEVQHALARLPAIQQCVVVVREKSPGDAHLVAYYTLHPGQQAAPAGLKSALRAGLPEYMVPSLFVPLDALPLTQNGKIDQKALPDPFALAAGAAGGGADSAASARAPLPEELVRAEALLADHPMVGQVALALPAGGADQRPLAFVVARAGHEPGLIQFRKHLRGKVAEAWMPGTVTLLERLPLRADGSVDRCALLTAAGFPADAQATQPDADAPRAGPEALLAQAWRDMLGLAFVGRRDNFFNLGGNSLQSIQMIVRIEKRTGHRLNPRHVLLNSLEQLAASLPAEAATERQA